MKFEQHANVLSAEIYITNNERFYEVSDQDRAWSIIRLRSNGLSYKGLSLAFCVYRQRLKQI